MHPFVSVTVSTLYLHIFKRSIVKFLRLQKEDVFFLCRISERIQLETLPAFADLDLHIPPCLAPEQCRPMAGGLSEPGMPGVTWHPQILTDQLTLSQPGGVDYTHHITIAPP